MASHDGMPAARARTLGYVVDLDAAVRLFWPANAAEIKRRCAPSMPTRLIDQQEVFGFALADGLGLPILPGDCARSVGQSGDDILKGTVMIRERERPDGVYFIISGECKLLQRIPETSIRSSCKRRKRESTA